MTNNLTLIESEVLDKLIEDSLAFKQLQNPICGYVLNQIDWKQVESDKAKFLSKYVEIKMDDPNGTIETGLEKLGYE